MLAASERRRVRAATGASEQISEEVETSSRERTATNLSRTTASQSDERPAHSSTLVATSGQQTPVKLANQSKQRGTETPTSSAHEPTGREQESGAQRASDQKPDVSGSGGGVGQSRKVGLLGALLGDRGKSWLEHRNVILNIQNGSKTPKGNKSASNEKEPADERRTGPKCEIAGDKQQVEASRQQSEALKQAKLRKYSGLPTFGSVPQKLNTLGAQTAQATRLPYFSYHGRPRNVDSRARPLEVPLASDRLSSSGSQLTSPTSSSGVSTSPSASAERGKLNQQRRPSSQRQRASVPSDTQQAIGCRLSQTNSAGGPVTTARRRAALLGFSNLSNLFPDEPVRPRLSPAAAPGAKRSASALNLRNSNENEGKSRQRPEAKGISFSSHKGGSAPLTNTTTARSRAESAMRRATNSSQQLAGLGSSLGQQQYSAAGKHEGGGAGTSRLRPSSASGHYGGYLARQRSPAASHRLDSAGMSPLVDPDCPMHGDTPTGPPLGGAGRGSRYAPFTDYERAARDIDNAREGGGYYGSSQPDLVYSDGAPHPPGPIHDPYNSTRADRNHRASPPLYSPLSPVDQTLYADSWNERGAAGPGRHGGVPTSKQGRAYYNGQSRFSLYQRTGDGRIGSSLAPASEQLRRILGYKPAQPHMKPVHLHPQWAYTRPFIHLQPAGSGFGRSPSPPLDGEPLDGGAEVPRFAPFNQLQDNQAIRAVDFHPSGEVYAIGSNSRALRICAYPAEHELRHFEPFGSNPDLSGDRPAQTQREGGAGSGHRPRPPRVLFKFLQVHRGSIYCVGFNPSGQLLATGSNDQTIHIVKYNSVTHNPDGEEFRLTMHNGTVRDLCFIDDSSGNGSSLLLSAGGGDNKIYVTDCDTITPFQSMAGHTQTVMALNHCGGAQFVSGSYDRTIRFWDLRSRSCTSIMSAPPSYSSSPNSSSSQSGPLAGPGAPVCALRVDPSGRLLASGHTDTTCMLYDIRGAKIIQTFKPHDDEIRAISFSPKSYYLLTGGYDGRLVVSDLQGDLTQPLPSVCVAESQDKIVQAKWHPADFTFVSTSADKSATLWSLPGEIRN